MHTFLPTIELNTLFHTSLHLSTLTSSSARTPVAMQLSTAHDPGKIDLSRKGNRLDQLRGGFHYNRAAILLL